MKKVMMRRFLGNIAIGSLFLLWVSPFAVASVPEKWEPTGAMATARSNHTATSLSDSMILIVGGIGPNGPLASAELYDPQSGAFSVTTGLMGTDRADHTVSLIWGQLLIVGGTGPNGPLASAELYDPQSGTFNPTGSMNTARAHHTATVVSGPGVLIVGGTCPSGSLASAELYDPVSKAFSPTNGSMQTARAHHTATILQNGTVLIAGGTGPSGPLSSAELYNPQSKTFSPTAGPMALVRSNHTATSLPNGMVLIVGGTGPSGSLASAELYDPVSKTFSPTAGPMALARSNHTATSLPNGMILIAGGTGPGGQLDSAELYDPQTGIFSATLQMGSVREKHTANLLVNGKVLLAGGTGPGGQLASAKLYCPSVYFNWQFVGTPLGGEDIYAIRVDPENENLWYVGSQASGIYVTRNSGNTWEKHLNGIVKALEIDPDNHRVVYASSGSDLYKSADQGVTWSLVHSFPAVISDPSKSPVDSPTIIDSMLVSSVFGDISVGLASTFHHGRVYKSSDGGAIWNISFESEYGLHIWDIEEDPISGYLYFCTENPTHISNALVMRSEDRGQSWKDIDPLQSPFGHGPKIQVHPVTQNVYFLTESQRVLYKSGDFGDTWTGNNVDINGDLIIDKNYPNRFFGAALISGIYVGGVYFSDDTGESFAFGGLAGTNPLLALNGTSTKLFAAAGAEIYVASIDITPTENITNPNTPSGAITGTISKNYKYLVGGSVSSLGHPVDYQFDWKGDGSDLSPWGSATQAKTWTVPGAYIIRARARCTTHTSVLSDWSNPLSVSISTPKIAVTPAAYDFEKVKVKRTKASSFVVKNSGTVNLSITSAITGPDASMFKITSGSGSKTIKPGKSLTMKVAFKPTSTGGKISSLEITSNDPAARTLDIPLSGTGQ
jgi:hypothetical protein